MPFGTPKQFPTTISRRNHETQATDVEDKLQSSTLSPVAGGAGAGGAGAVRHDVYPIPARGSAGAKRRHDHPSHQYGAVRRTMYAERRYQVGQPSDANQ